MAMASPVFVQGKCTSPLGFRAAEHVTGFERFRLGKCVVTEFDGFTDRFGILDLDDLRTAFDVRIQTNARWRELELFVGLEIDHRAATTSRAATAAAAAALGQFGTQVECGNTAAGQIQRFAFQ